MDTDETEPTEDRRARRVVLTPEQEALAARVWSDAPLREVTQLPGRPPDVIVTRGDGEDPSAVAARMRSMLTDRGDTSCVDE